MPGLMPASSITCSASPKRSRASSVEKESPTIGATGRCACGNCGSPGCARQAVSASARKAALFHILDLDGLASDALRQGRGHESVEIAVEHIGRRSRSHTGAQVFDELIGLENIGPDLVAPADVGLGRV